MPVIPCPYDEKVAKFLRKQRGSLSYREFAPKLGLTKSVLYRLESQEQSITLSKLHTLSQKLKVRLEDILSGKA